MNIVVDENIAFAEEAFSKFGNVELMHGRKISNSNLQNADALIVRSITKVNEELLKSTPVKFVGTATIGTDHIDQDYLKSMNIYFSDAKGCNADAVAEYVFTSIFKIAAEQDISLKDKTIGVVGIGNIGSRIVKLANALGMKVLMNDPPLKRKAGSKDFVPLKEIYSADIITLHVPLNKEGEDKTVHLFNIENLNKLNDGAIFINASRGQVTNNLALSEMIEKKNLHVVLDVWEDEPDINIDLLKKVKFASPHVAGYSLEGKVNGTAMIYNALCKLLNVMPSWQPTLPEVSNSIIELKEESNLEQKLNDIFSAVYDIKRDDNQMRNMFGIPDNERPKYFDSLRKNYSLRREFPNYNIKLNSKDDELIKILQVFRFNIIQ
ncbi:MAG: 4-phosphoerythronate dehydrogenase [Bacteroidetes bacterium]|nr:4-phosphoerythronate dehydrogenase [Bacteroidota bacterium]